MEKSVAFGQLSSETENVNGATPGGPGAGTLEQDPLAAEVTALEQIESEADFDQRLAALMNGHGDKLLLWIAKGRRLIQRKEFEHALEHVRERAIAEDDVQALIAKVELLYDAQAHGEAEELAWRVVEAFPEQREFRLAHAKRLFVDGYLIRSHALLEPIHDSTLR